MKKYIVCFYGVSLIQGFTSGVKQYNIFILVFFFLKEVLLKLCNECWVSVPERYSLNCITQVMAATRG